MQLRHHQTIVGAGDGPSRITVIAWSPNLQKLAVASVDRTIQIFDDQGERKDKFATKPSDPKVPLLITKLN
jgi:intraflagellar transport protein 172